VEEKFATSMIRRTI